jgi:hypothetical protein
MLPGNRRTSFDLSADDLDTANNFLEALAAAAETGDRERVVPFLAASVEWVTPKRTLHGVDEILTDLTWLGPPDNLEVEFERGEMMDHGDGRIALDVHETYRMRGSGEFAYARDRRIELTIHGDTVARYEMRIVG